MTTSLHAHISTFSSDCDGPMYRDFVKTMNDAEIAHHEQANGVNDFSSLMFKERILSWHVSFSPLDEAEVRITRDGFDYVEATDEGMRRVEVRWCEDDCATDQYSQRDVFAEQMGY